SSNVPLKDTGNTFTSTPNVLQGNTFQVLRWNAVGGATDEKIWDWEIRVTGGATQFNLRARDDNIGTGSVPLSFLRSGTTVTEIEMNATTLDFNGNMDVSGNA